MKKLFMIVVVAQFILFCFNANAADIEEKDTIKKILKFSDTGGEKELVVDNVFGSITIIGYNGQEVQMSAQRIIKAKTKDKITEGKEKVFLDITEDDNFIEIYVDGPFRNSRKKGVHWRGYKKEGYKVTYHFDIKVPRDCNIEVKAINEGEILISDITGNYNVKNINGGIEMKKIAGSGRAYALNGDLTLDFNENPGENCYFGSLNGEVKIYFKSPLSADFQLKTFNGDVFSDFPVTYLPTQSHKTEKKAGKKIYKTGRTMGIRAGKGGPEIELDGFNGDMFILKK